MKGREEEEEKEREEEEREAGEGMEALIPSQLPFVIERCQHACPFFFLFPPPTIFILHFRQLPKPRHGPSSLWTGL